MKRWALYRLSDGVFVGSFACTVAEAIDANIPAGCAAVEGNYDHLSQRVDLETGAVVDYQPTRPDEDHDWDADTRRWRKRVAVGQWEETCKQARVRIDELERRQARPIRELARRPNDSDARRRIDDIEAEIEAQRAILNAPKPPRAL